MLLAEYAFIKDLAADILEGGAGSGHWGHKGRPGSRGGSLPGGTVSAHGVSQRRVTSSQMGRYLSTRMQRGRYTDVRSAAARLKTRFPGQTEDRYGRALRKAGFDPTKILDVVSVTPIQALTIRKARARYAAATQGLSKPITAPTTVARTGGEVGEAWNRLSDTIKSVSRGHGLQANVNVSTSGQRGYFSIGFRKEGTRVGSVDFSLDANSKSGYIGSFFMDRGNQGTGLGGNIVNAVLKHAQAVGVEKIGLLADGGEGIGRYAWAIMGFDFRGDRGHESNQFKDYLRGKGIEPGDMTFRHSWEIAAFEHNGNKLGKDYLMRYHGSYDAVFDLTPGSKSLMAFQNFMERRKVSEAQKVIKAA